MNNELFETKNLPIVEAVAPSPMKTKEKPKTKNNADRKRESLLNLPDCTSRIDTPDMKAIYEGTSGRMQGDRKESRPAKNAPKLVTF